MVNVSLRDRSEQGSARAATHSDARVRRRPPPFRSALFLVAAIAVVGGVGFFATGAGEGLRGLLGLSPPFTDETPVAVTVAGQTLKIPADMIRTEAARKPGAASRIDLAVTWPELEGVTQANAALFRQSGPGSKILYLTLRGIDEAGDTTSRLDDVYTRFFSDEAWAGPGGLVGVKLDEKSGYAGEELYFQPESDRPFVARCAASPEDDGSAMCLREVTLEDGLLLVIRFDRGLLADWQDMDPAVTARIDAMR
jgi:hypothetical protein